MIFWWTKRACVGRSNSNAPVIVINGCLSWYHACSVPRNLHVPNVEILMDLVKPDLEIQTLPA